MPDTDSKWYNNLTRKGLFISKIQYSINIQFSFVDAKDLLQKWREENCRNSEKIIDLWKNFDLLDCLGDESMYLS